MTDTLYINDATHDAENLFHMQELLEGVTDFSKVCRICATVAECVQPIFEEEGCLFDNLAKKINKYLPIKILKEDGLPQVVCYQCQNMVLEWDKLVQCSMLAKIALERKLSLVQQILESDETPKIEEISNATSESSQTGEGNSSDFVTVVKDILAGYYRSLSVEVESSDIEYVCQMCKENPSSRTVENLVEHLKSSHNRILEDKKRIETFIRDNVTFEEILVSDGVDDDTQPSEDAKSQTLPNYHCPFCESVFSSPSRLMHHLNKHIEISFNEGVVCCDRLYGEKSAFVAHLRRAHAERGGGALACKTCGAAAADDEELRTHIGSNHAGGAGARGRRRGGARDERCQKYIPVACPSCDRTFSNKYNLRVHMRGHSGESADFACDKCDKVYKSRGGLTGHRRLAHEGALGFPCPLCGEAFPTRAARDVHARLHTGARPFECALCGKTYRAKNTLDRHIDAHRDVRRHACHVCPKRWSPGDGTRRSDGGAEIVSDDDAPLAAVAARRKSEAYRNLYAALANLRTHLIEHDDDDRPSEFSDSNDSDVESEGERAAPDASAFDDLTDANMRKDRMDERTRLELSEARTKIEGKVYYVCGTCGRHLSSTHTYVFHRRIHTGERPCVCHICGKQFRAPNGLRRHVTETHERRRRYTCAACPRSFANSQNLKQHTRIHTGERPYVCPHCGKRFTQSGSLHAHLKTHSERLPHVCAECGARFRLRAGLARHRLRHTGERPHACAHCGRAFRQRHELADHALAHTGARPHACPDCGAAFRQRRALRHHRKRLHPHRVGDPAGDARLDRVHRTERL